MDTPENPPETSPENLGDETAKPYVLEAQVGFLLRQVNQRHISIFAKLMAEDLTPAQFSCLVKLRDEGTVSQNLLGRLAAMDAATIKGVIDRLTARGYVLAHPDPGDARLRVLNLTELGRKTVERAIPYATAITAATLAPLDAAERAQLLALLGRLC